MSGFVNFVRSMIYSTVKVQLSKVQVSGYVYFVTEVRTMAFSTVKVNPKTKVQVAEQQSFVNVAIHSGFVVLFIL